MGVWSPAFQHQFLDGNLLNFNAAPIAPGTSPDISFEGPLVRPTPPPEERGFPVRRGNRFRCEFEPATLARLAKIPNVIGVKEASGNLMQMNEIIRLVPPEFLVLSMWRSAAEHGKYRTERVERLALRVQTEADVAALTGDIVELEPTWTV